MFSRKKISISLDKQTARRNVYSVNQRQNILLSDMRKVFDDIRTAIDSAIARSGELPRDFIAHLQDWRL